MDTKSLAKSKRAHSLHQSKKNQHHHSSKGASSGPSASTGDKKQSGKQAKEKPAQAHGSRQLPSNWDRYVKEGDDGDGVDSGNLVPQDIVAPKSKGADFAYLISEAKGQARHSSQDVPLFDDVLHDFYQGFGLLLTVKGQSITSWIADDNFGSEDKAPPPDEATFLSLNLHSLAEQLSNATISERLFIEPDSLPELCMEELQKLSESKHEEVPAKRTSEVVSEDCESMYKFFNSPSNATNTTSSSSCVVSISTGKGSQSIDSVKDETLEIKEMENPKIDPNTAAKKPSSAEAELDLLLGSFPVGDVSEKSLREVLPDPQSTISCALSSCKSASPSRWWLSLYSYILQERVPLQNHLHIRKSFVEKFYFNIIFSLVVLLLVLVKVHLV